jgi:hypothetical protein
MARKIGHDAQIDLGRVVYNGFEFPPAINTTCSMTPVYDRSDRGLMYVRYRFRIEFIIYPPDIGELGESVIAGRDTFDDSSRTTVENEAQGYWHNIGSSSSSPATLGTDPDGNPLSGAKRFGAVDHQLAFLRRRLVQPGRQLTIAGIGLGPDLDVNDPVKTKLFDVVWGPKPRNINWEPIGSSGASRVIWEVDVGLVECEDLDSAYKERVPAAFSPQGLGGLLPVEILQIVYNANWSISPSGTTTKNYEAIIQVRGYIDPDNLPNLFAPTADGYRVYFEPPLLPGYRRTRKYALNDDKTQLTVDITDTEVDSEYPYPPGIVDIDVNYSISSSLLGQAGTGGTAGFRLWDASLQGRMTLAKGFHPYWRRLYPYYLALMIVRSRYRPVQTEDDIEEATVAAGGSSGVELEEEGVVELMLPLEMSLNESLFGREFGFTFRWLIMVSKPNKIPEAARFGYPPNIWSEDQLDVGPDDFNNYPISFWDWDLWIMSMIGFGGASTDDDEWGFEYGISVPNPDAGDASENEPTVFLTLLLDWGIKRAPMSLSGADNRRFEGDTRMEPCQNNPDFWYQTANPRMAALGRDTALNALTNDPNNHPSGGTLSYSSDVTMYEKNQTINAQPINNPDDQFSLSMSVDGRSDQGSAAIYGKVQSGFQQPGLVANGGGGSGYSNNIGDVATVYNPPQVEIKPTDATATKAQSLGPPSYMINVTGYALKMGTPPNPPRLEKWGEAHAIKSGTMQSVSSVQQVSTLPELWMVKWSLWYDLIGSPNGIAPQPGSESKSLANDMYPSPIYTEESTAVKAARRMG